MTVVIITLVLIAIAVIAYIYGAWRLAQYGFRISSGTGLMVLLFPPYTFYFAFYKLEQDGKEFPTTAWLFGLLTTVILAFVFFQPLSLLMQGRMDELTAPSGPGEAAVAAYGEGGGETKSGKLKKAKEETEEPKTEEEPEETAPAAGTNNAGTNNAGTNNPAGTTNGSPAGGEGSE